MELNELLLNAVANQNVTELKELIGEHYPVDVATALFEFEDEELAGLLNLLDAKGIAAIIEEAEEELQQGMIGLLDSKKIVKFFAYMSPDDITDILGTIGVGQRKEILGMMKKSDSNEIQMLLGYGPDTAGGLMTTKYIALRSELSMKNVLQEIRRIGPKTEIIETIFVVDKANELIGSADLRDILASAEDVSLEEIMNDNVLSVRPETDQEEVSLIVSKYDLKVIPVVNRPKRHPRHHHDR